MTADPKRSRGFGYGVDDDGDVLDGNGRGGARPRANRAVRLVDELNAAEPARKRCDGHRTEPSGANGCRDEQRIAAEAAGMRRGVSRAAGTPTGRRRDGEEIAPTAVPTTDGYAILSLYPEGEGETVAVVLSVPSERAGEMPAADGEDGSARRTGGQLKVHLLVEQYADLHLRAGEITPQQADELMEAGKLCAAVRRGMSLLQYGDRSARRLAYKLSAKGIDRETAEEAAAYLTQKGYIHEDDTARLRAEQDARKLWGPRRIRQDLRAQGFTGEAIEEAMEALNEVDFEENCAAAIRKKYRALPDDRAAQQKLVATLMRLGYDSDMIREAMRTVAREES